MINLINKTPVPIAGLMLALAGAGNLVISYGDIYRSALGCIAVLILLLLVGKLLLCPQEIKVQWQNPVTASVMPTFSMGLMLLSTYIIPLSPRLALGIWFLGISIHVILVVAFSIKYLVNFSINKVFASYFIVYVGIVVACVTAPAYNMQGLGQYFFWFGLLAYLILLPIVLYRVFIVKNIPEPAIPTLTIIAAPASLCLAGYLNSFPAKNISIVVFLLSIALISTFGVLLYMPTMLKLKFYPSYAAFTFPFVISAIAIKLCNGYFISQGFNVVILKHVVSFEEYWALGIVAYVFLRFALFFTAPVSIGVKSN